MKQRIYIAFSLMFFLTFLLLIIQSTNNQSAEIEEVSIVTALDFEPDGFEEAHDFQLNYFLDNWDVADFISNRRVTFFVYQAPRGIFVRELPVPPPEFALV